MENKTFLGGATMIFPLYRPYRIKKHQNLWSKSTLKNSCYGWDTVQLWCKPPNYLMESPPFFKILSNFVQFFPFFLKNQEAVIGRCSSKKDVLRNFAKFTRNHLCQRLFLSKVGGLGHRHSLWYRYFPVNFVKFLRTPIFIE